MAYATQVGQNVRRMFNRPMAYLKALLMVDGGYREVTILDDHGNTEAKIIRRAHGGLDVWTPVACAKPRNHQPECCCNKWNISKFVGTLMPMFNQMKAATAT